ncbi:hypothetical protein G9A89_018841 [Geosiphon pyriformis]|nr:hypothetical protein G9A89_018841 [Geosiphon pyriformis]
MELAIPLISPAVQIIGDNLKINSVTGGSTTSRKREFTANRYQQPLRKETKNLCKNKFKVVTTPDATTLEYYQSIYTHCKQRFNILDGIEVVKKSVYQYIENCINNYLFGNYNISEVRNNLYNNLAHYSQLGTEDLNSETLATYFQELNFNIIKYCEETYLVQSQYSIDFELKTETSNKGKHKLKQYSKTTSNTSILPKTTAKHLQTPEQRTSSKLPLTITPFLASLAQAQTPNSPLNRFARPENFISLRTENQSEHSETAVNKENNSEITEEESIDSENKEDKMTAYIAKIPEFNREDIETSLQEWLDQVTKNAARMLRTIPYFLKRTAGEWFENLNAFKTAFFEQFTNNNTFITLRNQFCNIKQEFSESVCSHVPEDLNSAIQHVKRYEMAMEEANCTKLVNLTIGETSSAAEKKIDQLTKKQPQRYQPPQRQNQNNFAPLSNNQPQNCHYYQQNRSNQCYPPPQQSYYQPPPPAYYPPRPQYQNNYYQSVLQPIQQQYQQPPIQHYQVSAQKLITQNQFTPQNQYQVNNNRISSNNQLVTQNSTQPRPNCYHTQPNYLTMPEEQDFHHTAPSEGRATAQQQNPSYTPTTIPPARIAENANLSDIFSFEFEANESPFLLNNVATNKQKAITAMYTKAEVKEKTIHLILNSGSARSIIIYQLIQQLKRNVNRPAQTIIVITNGMKKTPVGEIDNFPFTFDRITIPVKVFVIDAPQYQALVRNDWLQKANAKLDWKTQELQLSYQGQHTRVPATCGTFNKRFEKAPAFEFEPKEEKPIIETFMALESTSNWADETEQQYFSTNDSLETKEPVTTEWNVLYSKPEL